MTLEQAKEIARTMWEVQGLTMPQIAKHFGKSLGAVEKWGRVDGWARKGDLKRAGMGGEVRELTRAKFMDQLAEAGMPPQEAMKLFIEGMRNPTVTRAKIELTEKGEMMETTEEIADHKTRHKFIHDYMLISGAIGNNEKQGGAGGGGGSINIQVNIPEKK